MGGGDLNLKKSWHPKTFRNLKKLWEAEKAAEGEEQKVVELQTERNKEREKDELLRLQIQAGLVSERPQRLEWMYSSMGASEMNQAKRDNTSHKNINQTPKEVGKVEEAKSVPSARGEVAKSREDPLFLMKEMDKHISEKKHHRNAESDRKRRRTSPSRGLTKFY